jgi:hypothetical protein
MQDEMTAAPRFSASRHRSSSGRYVVFGIVALVALILLLHLAGFGLHAH